jgi:DNA (cytosine-5)-methyltransferase 1
METKKYKILNLYANIGGNRKLWGEFLESKGIEYEITAVELDPKIAQIYQDFWPHDKVVVVDAHQYLLDHYKEFDFIWSSPPCPTHSQVGRLRAFNEHNKATGQYSPAKYPDMKLYEEILFLQGYFKGKWCVENVIAWYKPLIPCAIMGGHQLWSNFFIEDFNSGTPRQITTKGENDRKIRAEKLGFNLDKYTGIDKRLALRDCTEPELGLHILKEALKETPKLF